VRRDLRKGFPLIDAGRPAFFDVNEESERALLQAAANGS
jgi:hypothetical protein